MRYVIKNARGLYFTEMYELRLPHFNAVDTRQATKFDTERDALEHITQSKGFEDASIEQASD